MFSDDTELSYGSKHRSQGLGAKPVVRVYSRTNTQTCQECITIDFIFYENILEIIHIWASKTKQLQLSTLTYLTWAELLKFEDEFITYGNAMSSMMSTT